MNNNPTFDAIRNRQAVRRFSQRDIPQELLLELLSLADRAPSGFNLQPWNFVLVRDPALRKLLCHVAMDQQQIAEAPATVVFIADPQAWSNSYIRVLALSEQMGAMDKERVALNRKRVRFHFATGLFNIFGFLKGIAMVIRRLSRPTPNFVCSRDEAASYVSAQTMLAAATFMIAAKSAGLDTCPMEGFDEYRLKKLLRIPSSMRVPIIIATGYPIEPTPQSVRLPLEEKVSIDVFGRKLRH